jgi:hypothetical protein
MNACGCCGPIPVFPRKGCIYLKTPDRNKINEIINSFSHIWYRNERRETQVSQLQMLLAIDSKWGRFGMLVSYSCEELETEHLAQPFHPGNFVSCV